MTYYLLYTDETNTEPVGDVEFFIYGGVFFPVEQLGPLTQLVTTVRDKFGFVRTDEFKFHTRSRPANMSVADYAAAKGEVLAGCADLRVRFVAVVILHDIARHQPIRWSHQADILLLAFDSFVSQSGDGALVVMDRTESGFEYAREKFSTGVRYDSGSTFEFSDRLMLFAQGCIGSSHIASVVDIVIGCFRYCVNDQRGSDATAAMLPAVMRLMHHRDFLGRRLILETGLLLRPRQVKVEAYRDRYDGLVKKLDDAMTIATGSRALWTMEDVIRDMQKADEPAA